MSRNSKPGTNGAQTSFRLSPALHERVQKLARADGTSDGAFIRKALEVGVATLEGAETPPVGDGDLALGAPHARAGGEG